MTSETIEIANAYREAGHIISDEECETVFELCMRKMAVAKVQDTDMYMPLVFADELKNFLIRRFVNAIAKAYMQVAKEG